MTAGRMRPRLGLGSQVIIVVLVVGLFGALAVEPTRQLLEQRERLAGISDDLSQVERSNERLETRIDRLKNPDFLEQRARALGLVRAGETTYIVMPPSHDRSKGNRRRSAESGSPPPEPALIERFLNFVGIP